MAPAVLIVEDDACLRAALASVVRNAADLTLAGVAGDVATARRLLDATQPDVLLVDIGLPGGSGIELIRHAKERLQRCEVMVFTVFDDEAAVLACIAAGATGYLLKGASEVDIVAQIRLLLGGGSPISPSIARGLLKRIGASAAVSVSPMLSSQEQTVLTMSAKGYNYEEIARLMQLSRHTVETYVKRIYRKLQVHSKTEAVYEARKLGLVDD